MPAIVLWLHFGVFFHRAFIAPTSTTRDDGDEENMKRIMRRFRIMTGVVCASAVASTIVLCLGILYRWEILFVVEFIFFEGVTLWAIGQAVRPQRRPSSGASAGTRADGLGDAVELHYTTSSHHGSSYVSLPWLSLTLDNEFAGSTARKTRLLSGRLALSTSLTSLEALAF